MGVISTQGFVFKLIANGTQLDLFNDEDYLLSNNVTGVFDLGLLPSDFTRQITLPGTKVNNAFFEHVYDISIDSPFLFATNTKVPAYFDFGGIYLSNGYLQLNKVNVIANKFIDSYEVSIYGGLSSFARDVNRYFLTDLTSSLAQFNHTSSLANISASWGGNLFNGDVVYPLAEYGQQISYTPNETQFGIDSPSGSLCVQDFKPAIRIKKVWDAIFNEFGYTYTGSFWEQSWLDNVYMIANNQLRYPVYDTIDLESYGLFKISPISGSGGTNTVMTINAVSALDWFNIESNPGGQLTPQLYYNLDFNTSIRGEIGLNFEVSSSAAGNGIPNFQLQLFNTGSSTYYSVPLYTLNTYMNEVQTYNATQTKTQTFQVNTQFNTPLLPKGTYSFGLSYTSGSLAPGNNFVVTLNKGTNTKSYLQVNKVNQGGDGLVLNMAENLPYGTNGIKLIDFITSIQKKFNLVMYPNKNKPQEFIVEDWNVWYRRGKIKDFNKYINLDEKLEVISANNLAPNKLTFGDTLDGDYISQQFSKLANRTFGTSYYVDTENFFSQGTFEVKTGFASSPLVYLAGTGVSGSASGGGVIAYSIGDCRLTVSNNIADVCTDNLFEIYSTTGTLVAGATLYFDPYGNNLVTGYRYISNAPVDCEVFSINRITGEVITSEGYSCPECV